MVPAEGGRATRFLRKLREHRKQTLFARKVTGKENEKWSRPRAAGPHGFFVNYMNIENKRCSQEKSEEDWDHQALSWRFFSAIEYSNQEDV